MTTSPLKAEDSRAQFEVWANRQPEAKRFGFAHRDGLGSYVHSWHKNAWLTWQASRAVIVVELPDYTGEIDDELSCFDGEYEWGNRAGASYAVTQCAGIIRAAGITVKGDSDGK